MLAKGLVLLGSKDPEMLLVENFHISIYLLAARRLPSSDREWCFNRKQQAGADSAEAVTGFWLKFNRIGLKIGRVKVQMCFWNLFIKTSHFVMNITGLGWGWAWQPAIILWDLSQNSLIERCHSSANHRRELIDGEDWTPRHYFSWHDTSLTTTPFFPTTTYRLASSSWDFVLRRGNCLHPWTWKGKWSLLSLRLADQRVGSNKTDQKTHASFNQQNWAPSLSAHTKILLNLKV